MDLVLIAASRVPHPHVLHIRNKKSNNAGAETVVIRNPVDHVGAAFVIRGISNGSGLK
jgi:hypothetical protein